MASYAESQIRLAEAVAYRLESYRWLEKQFNINRERIRQRVLQRCVSRSQRPATNLRFNPEQDKAFSNYIRRLWEIGVPLRYGLIRFAADTMLKATHIGSDQPPKVGVNWATKWLRSHSEFKLLLNRRKPSQSFNPRDGRVIFQIIRECN